MKQCSQPALPAPRSIVRSHVLAMPCRAAFPPHACPLQNVFPDMYMCLPLSGWCDGSLLLRPALLPQAQFLALGRALAALLGLPGPVLAQALLGVAGVVEVDLRDARLDERPDAP